MVGFVAIVVDGECESRPAEEEVVGLEEDDDEE